MSKLHSMEKIVLEILEENYTARQDDYYLMLLVCQKLNPDLIEAPLGNVLMYHKANGFPSWETVTRCRRKIQEKHPELVNPNTARKRRKEEETYREYAQT